VTAEDTVLHAPEPGTEPPGSEDGGGDRRERRRLALTGHRLVWFVAGVAVLSLVAGIVLSRLVVSPAQAAADAEPPEAGPITVPVERRTLDNDVTLRADATYDDAVSVKIETGDLGGPAVVTGQVPEVGAELGAANVALEIAGRPVIVLPGELPAYRSLRVGVSGPDVLQLKAALGAVGIDPGRADSDLYDAATASAVEKLYAQVGYPAPSAAEEATLAVSSAREGVRAAEDALDGARAALSAAQTGASDVEKLQADNAVRAAQRAVAAAQAEGGDVAGAQDELRLAQAQRAELDRPSQTAAESAGVESARRQLTDAQEALEEARTQTLTALPASEVLFLAGLPRRVDEVQVERGSTIEGPVMSVSGATLVLEASAAASDAELLEVGAAATLTLPDDSEATATVTTVEPASAAKDGEGEGEEKEGGSGRYTVSLTPDALTPEQVTALQGQNVRIRVPVSSTGGEVLAVPLAALTAGPGGESRVEVRRGSGADATTELVDVETGLAAQGFVEIVSADGELDEGDLVVVGE
jgi:multidrug efflux pump subunit AcrA (membrane-fusion protein)